MQAFAAKWLESFKEFPPRQKPASFNLDEVMDKITTRASGSELNGSNASGGNDVEPARCRETATEDLATVKRDRTATFETAPSAGKRRHTCRDRCSRQADDGVAAGLASFAPSAPTRRRPRTAQPNILVIFGDDIGQTNISAYSSGSWATVRRTSTASPARA